METTTSTPPKGVATPETLGTEPIPIEIVRDLQYPSWACPRCDFKTGSAKGVRSHFTKVHTPTGRSNLYRRRKPVSFDVARTKRNMVRTAIIGVSKHHKGSGLGLRYQVRLLVYRQVRFLLHAPGTNLSPADREAWESIREEFCLRL